MMKPRVSTFALALIAATTLTATNAFALDEELNDTQAALSDVAAQATVDNCPCPEPGSAEREVKRYEACLKKSSANALKAFKTAIKFVGASATDFRSSVRDAVVEYDAECRASWEPSPEEGEEPLE